ncbi:hypothetical protein ECTPHS_13637 [Ectothiorhodospira sp. PHS-1]|nr:hypothetical protein ECTPHS_13637 [Ectothiorhodospira sp. PHS-1]
MQQRSYLIAGLIFSGIWLMGESKLWQMYVRAPLTILLGISIAFYFINSSMPYREEQKK